MEQRKLPTLTEIINGDNSLPGKLNELNVLLNQEPPALWLKELEFNGKKVIVNGKPLRYIPIDKIEFLLTKIFITWYPEIIESKLIANSVCVTVRLHYKNPVSGEMLWCDGIGACALQTNAGEKASDFDKIKSDSVMKAAPAAKSYAIKDAAECLGKIFGKDLNRKDTILYDSLLQEKENLKDAKITEK
jgi:hypothetical protein